jgi:integrase
MPTVMLTARFVDSVKPDAGKRIEWFDEDVPGLALRVTPAGSKSWTVLYRHRGRLRRLTLGTTEVVSLAKARERARDELYAASKGADPATEKQAGRKVETVGDLVDLYLEKWAKPRKRSWKADDNLLRRKVLPKWRYRAIVDIKRRDVRELVEHVADAGAPVVANRVAALLSKVFAFAVDRDLVVVSPAVRIPRPGREQTRDRVLSEDEIRALWTAFDKLEPPMAAFYKLRLLTAQRGGEVASMRWNDVDLEGGWWTIPAAHSKNKLTHRVPLTAKAINLLGGLLATAHKDAELVLEAHQRKAGAGARGKRQQALAAATFPVDNFRGHDLRRTAASLMASGGVPRLTIKKILNHVDSDITAVYDRHSYDPEKRAALDWWALRLQSILRDENAEGGKVLPFAKGA